MSALQPRTHEDGRSRLVAYDHGATLASWELDGRPVIWLSPRAVLDGTRAIRGGVPICFPWFADGPTGDLRPSHGVVRTATWRPAATEDGEVWAWALSSEDVADVPGSEHLPGPFRLRSAVSLGDGELTLRMSVHNPGPVAYRAEVALHTYLAVADLDAAEVHGLDGAPYLDKVTGSRRVQEGPVRFRGETDNVYDSPGDPRPVLHDGGGRRVVITPVGTTQTVVWNPGPDQAAEVDDVGPGLWRDFVCVEVAATGIHALEVPPDGSVQVGLRLAVRTGDAS